MKNLLALFVFLVPLAASGQDRNWIRTLGGPSVDTVRDAAGSGGTLFFGGSKDFDTGASRAWFLATDETGARLADLAYEDAAGRPAEILALATGGAIHAAGHLGGPGSSHDLFVMRLSPQGAIEWQTELRADGDQAVGDLIPLRDGGLLLVGSTRAESETKRDGWAARLDAQGAIVWQKAFRSEGDDEIASGLETPRGDLVLVGQVGILRQPDNHQGWILSLDAAGNLLWQNGYEIASSDGLKKILRSPGGYLAVGSAFQLAFFRADAWVLEVNRAGGLVRSRLLGDFEVFGHDEFVDAWSTKAGGFVAVGSTETVGGPSSQIWAAQFDNRARPVWLRHFGGDAFDLAGGSVLTAGGDLAIGGWSQQSVPEINDGLLVRTVPGAGGSPSCPLTGALPPSIYDFTPVVRAPVVTESVTGAVVVPGSLITVSSATSESLLCSF